MKSSGKVGVQLRSSRVNSYTQALSTRVQKVWDTPNAMRKVIQHLTGGCTLDAYNNTPHFRVLHKNEVLSNNLEKKKINKKRLQLLLLITSLGAPIGASPAVSANYSIDHLKLYAHSRILDYKEFQCFNKIITKESRWSYTARNGSHYGLGQMRSKHYRDLDPFRQIDATLRYVTIRYQTPCKAWAFHQERNYY
jgi:hypothetical protein